MSQTVIFEIGAVVFVAVTAAVFLYGMSVFSEWQDRDDTRARIDHPAATSDGVNVTIGADETPAQIVPLAHTPASGLVSRPSAA